MKFNQWIQLLFVEMSNKRLFALYSGYRESVVKLYGADLTTPLVWMENELCWICSNLMIYNKSIKVINMAVFQCSINILISIVFSWYGNMENSKLCAILSW